jgi:hypothetical protein
MPTFRRSMLSVNSGAEDGDMFLRNVAIDLQIHKAPKPKTSTSTFLRLLLICVKLEYCVKLLLVIE